MAAHLVWEVVESTDAGSSTVDVSMQRARVPGGWLVRWTIPGSAGASGALTFVPLSGEKAPVVSKGFATASDW